MVGCGIHRRRPWRCNQEREDGEERGVFPAPKTTSFFSFFTILDWVCGVVPPITDVDVGVDSPAGDIHPFGPIRDGGIPPQLANPGHRARGYVFVKSGWAAEVDPSLGPQAELGGHRRE